MTCNPFLCIFWNSSGIEHYELLESGLTVYSDVYNLPLTQNADRYRSHHGKVMHILDQRRWKVISKLKRFSIFIWAWFCLMLSGSGEGAFQEQTCLLVLAAAFTLVGLSRHHQGMVMFLGWLAHPGPQSRRRCIYWLCSSSQACLPGLRAPERPLFTYTRLPFWF